MVESSKGHHEEFEDDEEVATHKGKGREKNRTKHSETEQRRRSKINERFQILRDLIPQNDQKRDKASFLLEVIEYIQFLQEKLTMYEGPYQGAWSSEPKKLIPWKNDHMSADGFADPSQAIKHGSDLQNNVVVSPSMLHIPPNSLEADVDPPVSDVVCVDPLPLLTACVLDNNTPNVQEEKCGSVSISNSYSQGVLDNLTKALQSSGVDLSQASIAVQIDVANRADSGLTSMATGSKDCVSRSTNDQVIPNSQVTSASDKYEQAHKRLRVEHN